MDAMRGPRRMAREVLVKGCGARGGPRVDVRSRRSRRGDRRNSIHSTTERRAARARRAIRLVDSGCHGPDEPLQNGLADGNVPRVVWRRTKLAVSKEEEEAELKRLGYRSWAEANAAFDGANGSGWHTIPNRRGRINLSTAPTAPAQLAALLSARVPTSRELGADRARHLAMQALGPRDA